MARLALHEVFGLHPLRVRARETWIALRGAEGLPPSRFDLSSLGIFQPGLSLRTWAGRVRSDRRIPIYNLFNRTQTPLHEGWSVRKLQVRDFRGGTLTYDRHNGTDFTVPVGTTVVAAAPGKVTRISSEFNRGGLKVFIDHGDGLATTYNHLARSLVPLGQVVRRGQPIALSGYSGLDGLFTFPWGVPHVHFNVWLDGEYVDPFAAPGESSLWRDGNDPRPASDPHEEEPYVSTQWDPRGIDDAIAACTHGPTRRLLASQADPDCRAMDPVFHRNYFPTRFHARPRVVAQEHARAGRLTLPFRREDFTGIYLEEISARART